MNLIICGDRGNGKTTFCLKLSTVLKSKGWNVRGFLCPSNKIIDLNSGKQKIFLLKRKSKGSIKVGRFFVSRKAIEFGFKSIKNFSKDDWVFIDQYWKLELDHKGFYNVIKKCLGKCNLVIIVRKLALDHFLEEFSKHKFEIIEVNERNRSNLIRKFFQKRKF